MVNRFVFRRSQFLGLVFFFLFGTSFSWSQITDTLQIAKKTDTTLIIHTTLVGDSMFPTWEVTLKPASLLAMNSSFLGGEAEFKLRLDKFFVKGYFTGMYSQKLILNSIQNFDTPMYSFGGEVGYRVGGTEFIGKKKVKVFVKDKERNKKIYILERRVKRYSLVPVLGVNWMRFQPMFFGENSDGETFVSGDANVMNVNLGIHLDVGKAYRTQANSKATISMKRSSVDVGLMYGAILNYSWYQRSLYDSPYTYTPVSSDLFSSISTKRLGWYWKYNYTIGSSNFGGLTLGAMFGRLPRQEATSAANFKPNYELSFNGIMLGFSIGYTFSSNLF